MKIGSVSLSGGAKVCGVVVKSIDKGLINRAKRDGAELVEIRLDTFEDRDVGRISRDLKSLGNDLPRILTIRSGKEGGMAAIADGERIGLFRSLMPHVHAVDIELGSPRVIEALRPVIRRYKKKLIVSHHNFKSTPRDDMLAGIVEEARSFGADIVKIAATPRDAGDIKRLARLLIDSDDLVVIAMGDKGRGTRVFFPMLGSLIAYAAMTEKTAPGQPGVKELKAELERYVFQ